jgi:hypothetical protein
LIFLQLCAHSSTSKHSSISNTPLTSHICIYYVVIHIHHCEKHYTESFFVVKKQAAAVFKKPARKMMVSSDDSDAKEALNCMKMLTEVVSKRDEFSVCGDHIANKL